MLLLLRRVHFAACVSCLLAATSVANAGIAFGPASINFGTSSIVGGGGYPGTDGTLIDFQTGTITASDGLATFRIGITATPVGMTTLSNTQTDIGIASGTGDPSATNINPDESISFGSLVVLEFDDGGGTLTAADITALQINNIVLDAAKDTSDTGTFELNNSGVLHGWDDAGQGGLITGEGTGGDAGTFDLLLLNSSSLVTNLVVAGTDPESGTSQFRIDSIGVSGMTPVPEPSSFLFLSFVGLGYIGYRRYRNSGSPV